MLENSFESNWGATKCEELVEPMKPVEVNPEAFIILLFKSTFAMPKGTFK